MKVITFRPALWLIPARAIGALLALAEAPAAGADPPPPPPLPGTPFLPNTGFIPGAYGYLYRAYFTPPPATVDARGVKATALGDQQALGMPGSELGNSPPVAGFFTGASAQYYINAGATATPPVV